jgi:hypothetical protein
MKSYVQFKEVLESFCTSLLPDFCKAVEAAETLFPSCDNVKEIQKMTTFDGMKLILNILLEKALQEVKSMLFFFLVEEKKKKKLYIGYTRRYVKLGIQATSFSFTSF